MEESLEVRELDLICLVKIHQFEESIKPSLLDFFFLDLKNAIEAPLEIFFQNKAIKVSIKTLKGLFYGYSLFHDPVLNLLDDLVFPIEAISEIIASNNLNRLCLNDAEEGLIVNQSNLFLIHECKELLLHWQSHSHNLINA
jgi:hypothetical protein